MHEIEARMAAWRARMSAAMPQEEEVVRELESHLRDHLDSRLRAGVSLEEAWAEGVRRLGDVHGLAREFARVRSPWWPRSWALRGIIIALAGGGVALLVAIAHELAPMRMTPLLAAHVATITLGYGLAFGSGWVGAVALLKRWRRPLGARERTELRALIFRLTCGSCVLVPIGIALGMVWSTENLGAAWSWAREEVGAVFVLIAAVLLLVAQLRAGVSDRLRFVLAVLGGATVAFGMFGARAVTRAVPIGWIWLALVACAAAVVLLRPRPDRDLA